MNNKQQSPFKKFVGIRGMGAALTAFVGLIIIYIAFGIINPAVFSGQNILNLLRSMSKYLLIGIAQSYVLITGNIDLSIGSMVGMSAMITATLMTGGMNPVLAIVIALVACLAVGVVNGYLVGKFKLPPFIATLGTMFVARGIAYMVNGNRNTDAIATGVGRYSRYIPELFLLWKDLGDLQHILDRTDHFRSILLYPFQNTYRSPYLCYRIQRGCSKAFRRKCSFYHSENISGKFCVFLCCRPYPLCTGRNGKYGSRQHV